MLIEPMLEGLHPNRPTTVMRLTTDAMSALTTTELLGEIFDPAETAVASFETEDNGPWLIEAYFAEPPDEEAIRDLLRLAIGAEADKAAFFSLAEKDWVAASLKDLKPVRAGRFLVHGAHDRAAVRGNDHAITIEAALAFGTGHHGTTRGCLLALAAALTRRRPRHVLDIGTGSGILAFAAAKAARRPIVAGDIDPVAIDTARRNARDNGVAPWIRFYVAPGVDHLLARRRRGFDLVFANILARPLRQLAVAIAGTVSDRGTLVLSGLRPGDVNGVLSAYAGTGFRLAQRRQLEGWATLVMTRAGASPRPLLQNVKYGFKRRPRPLTPP